ncbi:MAG: aminomethyltransferase family protein, partial [Nitratireductor sp.]|nr:aminomethyltransferase family protein [Nitratireductor sp.]
SFGMHAMMIRCLKNIVQTKSIDLIGSSTIQNIGFQIAGPKARDLLKAVAYPDISDMKFMDVRFCDIGLSRAIVQRVSYTGDLGYEIYVPADEQTQLYAVLATAGEPLGIKPFGMRAMMSLRLEKGFGSWGREFRPDYGPCETGMDRFVSWKKNADFIGRAAAEKEHAEGPVRRLCTFAVEADPSNLDQGDVWGDEPIFIDGEVVGFVTSGGFAHYAQTSVAIGFLPVDMIEEGREVEIEILGEMRKASLYTAPLFDPDGERMRG